MQRKYIQLALMAVMVLFFNACKEDEYSLPSPKSGLNNDVIKRSLGPNVAGLNVEFAYAMAIPQSEGKLVSAQVEASIPGAAGTYLETKSYYTGSNGLDVGIEVADTSVTSGNVTSVNFTADTCAATLRYYYKVPEEAKGKEVTFTFSATASNGQKVSYKMGPYKVAKMDMKLDLALSNNNNCYISVEDMAVYNAADAAAKADKIDLVYIYRPITGIKFDHTIAAPAALDSLTLPAGIVNDTKIRKVYGLNDRHLARLQYGIYVDDQDLQELDLTGASNYAINLVKEYGIWVETANKKYKAYIFVNSTNNNGSAVVSIKRYQMN